MASSIEAARSTPERNESRDPREHWKFDLPRGVSKLWGVGSSPRWERGHPARTASPSVVTGVRTQCNWSSILVREVHHSVGANQTQSTTNQTIARTVRKRTKAKTQTSPEVCTSIYTWISYVNYYIEAHKLTCGRHNFNLLGDTITIDDVEYSVKYIRKMH